jgi:hypothetical protein
MAFRLVLNLRRHGANGMAMTTFDDYEMSNDATFPLNQATLTRPAMHKPLGVALSVDCTRLKSKLTLIRTRFNDPSYRWGWSRPSGSTWGSFMCVVDAVSETPHDSAYEVPSPTALTVGGPWLSLELLSFSHALDLC